MSGLILILPATALAVLITAFLSGIFGMLGGVVLLGLLLAVLPVPAAMSLHAVTQMASTGWRAWLWRRYVRWQVLPGYAAGSLASFALFTALGLVLGKAWVYLGLGLTPFLAAALPVRWAPDITRRGMPLLCGALVTGLQLLAGVAGTLLDVFFLRSNLDRRTVVATKALTQVLGHGLKLAYFAPLAMTEGEGVAGALYAVAIVCALAGNSLGQRLLERMSDRQFRRWSQGFTLALGAFYLVQGVQAMLAEP
ncbi:MAG TPA: TSUP family transporter [Nevskiales bacterium]|nr:TSUP family transporter [Nevskiales bacterium]